MARSNRRPIQANIRTRPAGPGEFEEEFREALSHWASGVAVLAATDGEEIDAITISGFTSLSIDPPLVLATVGEQASVLPMIREEARFVISILSAEQQGTAGAVAQRLPGSEGAFVSQTSPALRGALARLECTLWEDYPGGDHRIIVGRVESVALGPDSPPLVYYRRGYRSLA